MPVLESKPTLPSEAVSAKPWFSHLLALVSAQRAGSLALHGLLAWPTALLPSVAFMASAIGLSHLLGIESGAFAPPDRQATLSEVLGAVVLAPLAETLLLSLLLWLLCKLSRRPLFVAAASGVIWGCAHGVAGLLWFFGTFWSFYIFSCSYLAWRPVAWWKAYVAAAMPHALINATAFAMISLS